MTKKLTITVSDEVYKALHRRIGRRRISGFIDDLARKHMADPNSAEFWLNASDAELAKGYAGAATDEDEREASEWIESGVGETLEDEDFSGWPGYSAR